MSYTDLERLIKISAIPSYGLGKLTTLEVLNIRNTASFKRVLARERKRHKEKMRPFREMPSRRLRSQPMKQFLHVAVESGVPLIDILLFGRLSRSEVFRIFED